MTPSPARVALESTVIAHGLPYPENLATARALEAVVRREGAEPQTIGIIGGQARVGLDNADLEALATRKDVRKVSLRDLPVVCAGKGFGATTVSATAWLAARAGIRVFATGGIGGVHRHTGPAGALAADISSDLTALAGVSIVVVCSGAKAILDLAATREALETLGVTVVGYGADEMPAFYSRRSGLPVDARCDRPEEVAALFRAQEALGLRRALLVAVPVPAEAEISASELEPAIAAALEAATAEGVGAERLTPFLLAHLHRITEGRSLAANLALLRQNAAVAARIACALAA